MSDKKGTTAGLNKENRGNKEIEKTVPLVFTNRTAFNQMYLGEFGSEFIEQA
ncbi:hypothetical protein [Lysinibacillus yapensis]|uniref:hypothetical protein n=1 Tax=Ureibacillus yapensis TaxID=2304605 RepID=UPI001314F412|nr:hypothetical protein [Lysinibacillus yapensis]